MRICPRLRWRLAEKVQVTKVRNSEHLYETSWGCIDACHAHHDNLHTYYIIHMHHEHRPK